MKKNILGLTVILGLGTVILSGCGSNDSSIVNEDKPSIETESGRIFACNEEVVKYLNIITFGGGWNGEEEAGASFVLDGEITYEENGEIIVKNVQCVVDMVDKSVTIQEIEEITYNPDSWKEIISDDCQHFFDGCNSCSKSEDGEAICTKMFCDVYQEPKCTDDEFVSENIDESSDVESNEDLPVAKMRISDDLTQEEIENQINETCGNMGGNWEEGSCVLEDGETIQF